MTEVVIPLVVRDLTADDVPSCAWSGSAAHLVSVGRAELGVEEDKPRARALYERLGYAAYGRAPDSWDEQAPDRTTFRYETMCTLMRKDLP